MNKDLLEERTFIGALSSPYPFIKPNDVYLRSSPVK